MALDCFTLKREALSSSKPLAIIYHLALCNISEGFVIIFLYPINLSVTISHPVALSTTFNLGPTGSSCYTSDIYGSYPFWVSASTRLSWPRFFVVFLRPSKQMQREFIWLRHRCFRPHPDYSL